MAEVAEQECIQKVLHKTFPLYKFMDVTVKSLGETVVCGVPLSENNSNHFGVVHAGVLFSLAEATAGIAVTQPKPLSNTIVIARKVSIEYLHKAKSDVIAEASVPPELEARIMDEIDSAGRSVFTLPVYIKDIDGVKVAATQCDFVLRAKI